MRKFGLIGYPLGHSFSKEYFENKFKAEGIDDVEYDNYPIEDISEFESLHQKDADLHGLNVTIPYKQSVIKYLDVQSADVREIGAVNTICLCRKTGKLARVGHNTDVVGFRRSLAENIDQTPEQALVLGTGGSSKAVVFVLKEMGVKVIQVSSSGKEGAISYQEVNRALIESSKLIVNTTPLGMSPNLNASPAIPYHFLSVNHLLFDLVYNPEETLFMQKGLEHGAKVVNGYQMLVYQAEGLGIYGTGKKTMEKTLHRNYSVTSYDVNPKGNARLTALANYLQETAYNHASKLGLGYHDLADKNIAWILSRMRIRVSEYPIWDDVVSIETWPRGIEKLFALRDFRIFNADANEIGQAATCWLMVDTETHRPLRIPPDFIKFETRKDAIFDQTPAKINLPEHLKSCDVREVKYSDLDVVGHVNNVKFIEWCIDAIPPDITMYFNISDIEINFISEAKPGEKVEIFCSDLSENTLYIMGRKTESEKECFRARVSIDC